MPHPVTGPNSTNLNQQNSPMFNPTIIGGLVVWGKGVPSITAPEAVGPPPFRKPSLCPRVLLGFLQMLMGREGDELPLTPLHPNDCPSHVLSA